MIQYMIFFSDPPIDMMLGGEKVRFHAEPVFLGEKTLTFAGEVQVRSGEKSIQCEIWNRQGSYLWGRDFKGFLAI